MPVYIFGNGGCSADGTMARNHLLEIASHGYLVVAPGVIAARHPEAVAPPAPRGSLTIANQASALTEAIDWATRENGRPQSPYYGRIDVKAIAVSGWSCGGLQAIIVAPDPRVKTLVVMNSGIFNGDENIIPGLTVHKAMLTDIHVPTLYVMGGPTDIAYANGTDDYARLDRIPAALVNIPVGHGGTYMQPHGGVGAEVVTHWLDWQLKGDPEQARLFTGPQCGYCHDARFTLETKNLAPQ
jgi:dienelactone hydrolase